jgi:hypothetical protein
MKISEFIDQLNNFKDKNGDLHVCNEYGYRINDIHPANLWGFGKICIITHKRNKDQEENL